mmetsp:Transcript_4627/g.11885  ORF Transcript_4627/g.11885 Transcript_4627/m.11885 type:complete len:475 (-) Transcript_4627:413-1837(-)
MAVEVQRGGVACDLGEDLMHQRHAAPDSSLLHGALVLLDTEPKRQPVRRIEEGRGVEATGASAGLKGALQQPRIPRATDVDQHSADQRILRPAASRDSEHHRLIGARLELNSEEQHIKALLLRLVHVGLRLVAQVVQVHDLAVREEHGDPVVHGHAATLVARSIRVVLQVAHADGHLPVELRALAAGQLPVGVHEQRLLVERARLRLPAPVPALHVALEARAGVAKLEHEALREARVVDRVGVGDEVEGGIEKLLVCNGDGHAAVHEALGVQHRACDCEDIDDVAFLVEGLLQEQDEHQHERVMRRGPDHGVAKDGVWLVLGVGLVCNHEASVLANVQDLVQALVVHGDHVGIHVQATIVPEELKAEDVRLALPHLLVHVDLLVEHRQLGHLLVAPHLEAPGGMRREVLYAEGVDPEAGRLPRADPDLVDHLGDVGLPTKVLHVPLAPRLPLWRVLHSAFTAVPVVVRANGADL